MKIYDNTDEIRIFDNKTVEVFVDLREDCSGSDETRLHLQINDRCSLISIDAMKDGKFDHEIECIEVSHWVARRVWHVIETCECTMLLRHRNSDDIVNLVHALVKMAKIAVENDASLPKQIWSDCS